MRQGRKERGAWRGVEAVSGKDRQTQKAVGEEGKRRTGGNEQPVGEEGIFIEGQARPGQAHGYDGEVSPPHHRLQQFQHILPGGCFSRSAWDTQQAGGRKGCDRPGRFR